jgi:hypothetical protein
MSYWGQTWQPQRQNRAIESDQVCKKDRTELLVQ